MGNLGNVPEPEPPQQPASVDMAKRLLTYELRLLDETSGPGIFGPPVLAALLKLDNSVHELICALAEN